MTVLDLELLAIAQGDDQAFARWVARAEPRIRRSLSSFAGRVDTEALVQDALLAVWQVAPRFQPDGRPEGLLRLGIRIAQHRAISELRSRASKRASKPSPSSFHSVPWVRRPDRA